MAVFFGDVFFVQFQVKTAGIPPVMPSWGAVDD